MSITLHRDSVYITATYSNNENDSCSSLGTTFDTDSLDAACTVLIEDWATCYIVCGVCILRGYTRTSRPAPSLGRVSYVQSLKLPSDHSSAGKKAIKTRGPCRFDRVYGKGRPARKSTPYLHCWPGAQRAPYACTMISSGKTLAHTLKKTIGVYAPTHATTDSDFDDALQQFKATIPRVSKRRTNVSRTINWSSSLSI